MHRMVNRVLLHNVLSRPEPFYGQQIAIVGYVVWKSDMGAAVYPEYGFESMFHPSRDVPTLWFDWAELYREVAYDLDRKYVESHATLQPAPSARPPRLDGPPPDRYRGWFALLDPVTYLLALSEESVPAVVGRQERREREQLLRAGMICPFCASSSTPRLLESSARFVCGDCGRSFWPSDVVQR